MKNPFKITYPLALFLVAALTFQGAVFANSDVDQEAVEVDQIEQTIESDRHGEYLPDNNPDDNSLSEDELVSEPTENISAAPVEVENDGNNLWSYIIMGGIGGVLLLVGLYYMSKRGRAAKE